MAMGQLNFTVRGPRAASAQEKPAHDEHGRTPSNHSFLDIIPPQGRSLPQTGRPPTAAGPHTPAIAQHTRSVYAASLPRPFVQNSFLLFFFTTNHRVLASDQLCQFKELCLNIQRDFHIRATLEKYILERKQYPDSSRSSLK